MAFHQIMLDLSSRKC